MKKSIFLLLALAGTLGLKAQQTYELTEPATPKQIHTGHLKLGGTAPDGRRMEVNSYYVTENGRPMIPVTGEFHYSRFPRAQWEESVLKMKAGGLTVIPVIERKIRKIK